MKIFISKLTEWIGSHKLVIGISIVLLLTANFGVRPRVVSYLKGPAEKYETETVKKQDLMATLSASGEIEAENQAVLKFQASGKLAWVGVKEGDHVEKWQAIASLDKRELEKKLKKEVYDYLDERWDFAESREDYNVTSDDLDRYTFSNDIRRILDQAQFDLSTAVLDVEIADLAVKYATLVSPIEGIITKIDSPVAGVNITPATATFTVADPSVMKFVANVDEADVANIRLGQKALISLDAYLDEEIEGVISHIAFAAVTTKGGGTAFPIEIVLPENATERFRVGMNGDAEIILDSRDNALLAPIEAIRIKNGDRYVQAILDKQLEEVTVKTGLENDNMVEILEGLEEGQTIVTGEKKKE